MFYIYQIINTINNESYIGYTRNLELRILQHAYFYNKIQNSKYKRKLLYKAIRKYKIENFVYKQIDYALSQKDAQIIEIYWINFYNTFRYKTKKGYNETMGGDGGATTTGKKLGHCSEERKRKISEANKGSHVNKGIKKSEEHKEKIRLTLLKPITQKQINLAIKLYTIDKLSCRKIETLTSINRRKVSIIINGLC